MISEVLIPTAVLYWSAPAISTWLALSSATRLAAAALIVAPRSTLVPVSLPSPNVTDTLPVRPKFSELPPPTARLTKLLAPCVDPALFLIPETSCLFLADSLPARLILADAPISSFALLAIFSNCREAPIPFLPTLPQLRNSWNAAPHPSAARLDPFLPPQKVGVGGIPGLSPIKPLKIRSSPKSWCNMPAPSTRLLSTTLVWMKLLALMAPARRVRAVLVTWL